MFCWKCQKKLETSNKIGFRSVCRYCEIDLHVCRNCRHFAPGKPNNCNAPLTEFILDREAANFCEEFSPASELARQEEKKSVNEVSQKLFQEKSDIQNKTFDSLF